MLYRLLVFVLLVFACTAFVHVQAHTRLAPADEYFGRMKMSILGIRNGLRTEALRMGDPGRATAQLGACHWLEDAIEDWGNKYPRDNWLPAMASGLEQLYQRVHTSAGHSRSEHLLAWMQRRYGRAHVERFSSRARIATARRSQRRKQSR